MKKKALLIVAVIAVCFVVYDSIVYPTALAKDINEYEAAEIKTITITNVKNAEGFPKENIFFGPQYNKYQEFVITDKKQIKKIEETLKSDYKVKRMTDKREMVLYDKGSLEYVVTFNGNDGFLDMYLLTKFNTIIVNENVSVLNSYHVPDSESRTDQSNRIEIIRTIIKDYE